MELVVTVNRSPYPGVITTPTSSPSLDGTLMSTFVQSISPSSAPSGFKTPTPSLHATLAPSSIQSLHPNFYSSLRPSVLQTTSSPFRALTTFNPSLSLHPTGCTNATISTDKSCYINGDNIIVSFENCDPLPNDWIGVYPSGTNSSDLGNPLAWVWACGDQACSKAVASGEATLYGVKGHGIFELFLVRHSASTPYHPYAESNTFQVAFTC